ncbi:MAG: UvrD-helicase domain-containing protein [Kiritimatiellae bacterium]|nr:UvrD-helicase domain-containing protein [Kiritimatiellia bacterium]
MTKGIDTKRIFSEEIFDPAFVLEGPHLVAASAGTGKTYNIQNIYARLVAEKGFRVAQIQVMTFTEAATKELRARVRAMLSNMARFLANETKDINQDELDRLEKLRDCVRKNIGGADADAVARARIELALMEFDQASISTIHGFCRRALVRFAFETNSAFRSEFADTKRQDLSHRVRDWWRCEHTSLEEPIKSGLSLGTLDGFVQALSGKSGWSVDEGEVNDPNMFALARAKEIVNAYEEDRPARDTQTYDDLLRGLQSALRDKEKGASLAARLREEFKAALVDEFQDTDPVQYDIFRLVFLDPEVRPAPTLFFVGDPKQAIYSFRGGDIYTYKKAVTDPAVEANTFRLDKNFRSTPRLIDAVNALFMDDKNPDGSCDYTFGNKSIDYPDALRASDKAAFTLPDGTDDPSPFRIVEVDNKTSRNQAVVDTVLGILEEQRAKGLTPRDIAILVTSHTDGADYRDMLRDVGVPAVLQKAGNVFAGELASDLRQVLMAMAQMGGRGQVKAALLTRFFSSNEALFADEEELADMVGFFSDLNQKWQKRGFNAAFAALEAHPRCDFRRNLAKLLDGERLLADLMQIVDLAGSAVKEIGPSPEALVNWITERINQSGGDEGDSEEYARQLESESDALKIMTIHVSKGLEFPVVIVPLTDGMNPKPPFFYHDEDSNLHVGISEEAQEKAQVERDAERMRLLYVAFTRATKRTVVVTKEPAPETPLGRLFENARRHGAGEDDADSPIAWLAYELPETPLPPYIPPTRQKTVFMDSRTPRTYSMRATKGSYSSLSPESHGSRDTEHDFDIATGDMGKVEDSVGVFSLPGGTKTGTCWHAILEKLPFDASVKDVLEETKRALSIYGLRDSDEKAFEAKSILVAEMMTATLEYPLQSPRGDSFTLRDIGWADRFSEWEFDFSSVAAADNTSAISAILREEWGGDTSKKMFLDTLDGWNQSIPKGYLKGFLDLVFRKDGYYYVVDWKSNRMNGCVSDFTSDGITVEIAKEWYFFQYLLYSVVLHRFLKETLGTNYSWDRNFGGVRYYFLRGIAAGGDAPVFADRPSETLLDKLSVALGLKG